MTGETLEVKGRQTVSMGLGGQKFDHTFLVFPLPTEAAGLIGIDFLEGRSAYINVEDGKMSFNDTVKDKRARGDKLSERRVLTVFTPGKEGHSPQPMWQTEERKDERVQESPKIEQPTSQSRTWLVKGARKRRTGTSVQTDSCGETGNGEGAEPSSISLRGTCPNSNRRNFSSPDTLSS